MARSLRPQQEEEILNQTPKQTSMGVRMGISGVWENACVRREMGSGML